MKNGLENVNSGIRAVREHKDAPIRESHPLWNDPSRRVNSGVTGLGKDFDLGSARNPIERGRSSILARLKRLLRLS